MSYAEREVLVSKTRRDFLSVAAGLMATGISSGLWSAQQMPPPLPMPGIPRSDDPLERIPTPRRDPEKELRRNQEDIRKDMTRLKQLVDDLQKEFDANSTTQVFSIGAVKKTEEIEKLAKDIRNLMRGQTRFASV